MNKKRLFLLAGLLVAGPVQAQRSPADDVNVFTGTSNSRWMLFPGPTLPFGLVKLSPDNQDNVWNGGYEYTIGSISGFSHLHAMSLSGVSLMPAVGPIEPYPGQPRVFQGAVDGPFGTMWTAGYRSRFRRETERGEPGYYAVHLLDSDVGVELTATTRTGWMRLRYPDSRAARLLLDLDFPAEEKQRIEEVVVRRTGPAELSGYLRQRNLYADAYTVHFVIQLSQPFTSLNAFEGEPYRNPETNYGTQWRQRQRLTRGVDSLRGGSDCGVWLEFPTRRDVPVVVKTGISLVSVANARLNLQTETAAMGFDFDAVRRQAKRTWNDLLGRVTVEGGTPADRQKFYTCLYRSYAGKSIVSDVNGQYTDPCEAVQTLRAPADAAYSADGFWGTQWNLTPLWTLLTPGVASSWVNFFLEMADRTGWMPEAPTGVEHAPIMGSQHHKALVVSSYQKGIRTFDAARAYAALRHDLTTPGAPHPCGGYAGNRQLEPYLRYGFVPDEDGAASNTLEYAYDDYAAAQLAQALGRTDDAAYFTKRSMQYRNLFDSTTGFVRRRHRDGRWVEPFDPYYFGTTGGWNGSGFMEGNAWLFTFFAPHDVPGLVGLLGRERFNERLEAGFREGHVDLGNQPNLQAPFLFNYSGKPWLTQRYGRHVLDTMYDTSPYTGWIGEEDEGQLSALFVLLAMGLFEMDGGVSVNPGYDLGSPLFTKITLRLDARHYGGKTFTIEAPGNSKTNVYIQSATLNGRPLRTPRITHADLVRGGTLVLRMGPKPNEAWFTQAP
jgi:predicted alpha-1,2-mannosidase